MTDYQIWPSTDGPNTLSTDVPISCGLEFVASSQVYAKGLRFYRGDVGILGPVTGAIFAVDGPSSGSLVPGTDVAFTLSGTGWQSASMMPVSLVTGQHYKAVIFFPTNYTSTSNYWETSPDIVNGPLTAPNTANATAGQDTFSTGASLQYPMSTFHGGNFWVDVVVTDTIVPPPIPPSFMEYGVPTFTQATTVGTSIVPILASAAFATAGTVTTVIANISATNPVFIGGNNVTATTGIQIPANGQLVLPASIPGGLWAISGTGSNNVVVGVF